MTAAEFKAWCDFHTRSCPRADWPSDAVFWASWKRRIDKLNCDLDTARAATERVAEDPPPYLDGHLKAVAEAVIAIYRERDAAHATPAALEERARRGDELQRDEVARLHQLAADCPLCGGNGLAVRHGRVDPTRTLTLHCTCVLGRWIRSRCRKTAPEVYRRIRDLAEHDWLNHPDYGGPAEHLHEHEPAF